jgi:hypothetical protein
VTVNLGAGKAEMQVTNLALGDYFTKANAFGANWQNGDVDATVSFDVVWGGPVTRRLNFQDSNNLDQFGGEFVENQASVTWSGSNANGFTFTANPGGLSTSFAGFAELAHVQNGAFFDAGSTDTVKADAGLAHVLTAFPTGAANPAPNLVSAPQRAEAHTATLVGNVQPLPPASVATQPPSAATHSQVLDQLFADLGGPAFGVALR